MSKTISEIENSINKTYREEIWTPFINAIKTYKLINENDKIAVCISGGKDSFLMALLFKMLLKHTDFPFEVEYLVMDPGYNKENKEKLIRTAEIFQISLTVFETNIFDIANKQEKSPCYLCAKMRRGHLYNKAKELGCNKIALGHHFSDVIETTVMSMFYSSQLQAMLPRLSSDNFENMELIRPLYCINERSIIKWMKYNELEFLNCACRFTEQSESESHISKRKEVKEIIAELKKNNSNIEKSIFNSIHNVCIETFPGYKKDGKHIYFYEEDGISQSFFNFRKINSH